jgi:hypothetical protein
MYKEPVLPPSCWMFGLLSISEDGGYTFLRNVGEHLSDYMLHISEDGNLNRYRCENLRSTTSHK